MKGEEKTKASKDRVDLENSRTRPSFRHTEMKGCDGDGLAICWQLRHLDEMYHRNGHARNGSFQKHRSLLGAADACRETEKPVNFTSRTTTRILVDQRKFDALYIGRFKRETAFPGRFLAAGRSSKQWPETVCIDQMKWLRTVSCCRMRTASDRQIIPPRRCCRVFASGAGRRPFPDELCVEKYHTSEMMSITLGIDVSASVIRIYIRHSMPIFNSAVSFS